MTVGNGAAAESVTTAGKTRRNISMKLLSLVKTNYTPGNCRKFS